MTNFFNANAAFFNTASSKHRSAHAFNQTVLTCQPVYQTAENTHTLPALFISHGAPTLAIEDSATTHALARLGQNLPTPKAIIIMSAHWLSPKLELGGHPKPATWHDFVGLTDELYQLRYPASGAPRLADTLVRQLNMLGVACSVNPLRAFDHGVWTPLLHLYPKADVPVLQIALPQHYDSYACYQLGALFAPLRREQILLIGSGNITHNLAAMRWHATSIDDEAHAFKVWLLAQLKSDVATALDWQQYPKIKQVHPTPEHLLPLFFALGAGGRVSAVHQSMAHHSLGMDIYRFD